MIVSMKRLTLIALKQDEENILKELQQIEAVQVISIATDDKQSSGIDKVAQRSGRLRDSLEMVKKYTKKPGMLTPKREQSLSDINASVDEGMHITAQLEELSHRRNALMAQREKSETTMVALIPFELFPYKMDSVKPKKHVRFFLGLVADKDYQSLCEQDFLWVERYSRGAQSAVLVACHEQDQKAASTFIKGLDWTDYSFPKLNGTPKEAIIELMGRIRDIDRELIELEQRAQELAKSNHVLEDAFDATSIEGDRMSAALMLERTSATFCLEGWIRSDQQELVEKTVASVTDAFSFDVREPNEDEVPPSVVSNSAFATPFEAVQNLYSKPAPKGIDGTPFMTPFYILLFGLMLSDAGYGLVLMLGSLLYVKLKKPTGMSGGVSRVLFWGGLSTIVWGVLLGTFFGLNLKDEIGLFPLWFDPMADSMTMLGLCFGLGVVHIIAGYIIKVIVSFKQGDWKTAIFDTLSWIFIIIGVILYIVPSLLGGGFPPMMGTVGLIMAGIGAAMILLFKGRGKRNPIKRTISGLGELYNISSILADVLSYARLFALGIATGVIASVFNSLCMMLMGGSGIGRIIGTLIGCILLVVLHLFNTALNTMGAFVHCARLQYVEFYGKFYEAGGRDFKPLGYRTKHIKIAK